MLLKNIKRIVGCSVGSIFSLFYLLGYKSKDILRILTIQKQLRIAKAKAAVFGLIDI